MTWAQALSWRMARQLLDPVGSESVAGVVRRLGAVLSMDEPLAELAARTRRAASRPGELAVALAEGEVVKAFVFRGSMHYLSPEEGGIYLALRSAGRQWELPSWVEYYRLTPSDWPDFRAAVRAALSDGPLTVAELGRALTSHRAYRHLDRLAAPRPQSRARCPMVALTTSAEQVVLLSNRIALTPKGRPLRANRVRQTAYVNYTGPTGRIRHLKIALE